MESRQHGNPMRKTLLVLSCALLSIGYSGGPLTTRLYFARGGSRTWLSTWLMTAGWPLIIVPLAIFYVFRRKTEGSGVKLILMKLPLFIAAVMIGLLTTVTNFTSALGMARLPVSTVALILSTSIVFTALAAFLLLKQKFTAYSINAILLLVVGAAVLSVHSSSDRPKGETKKSYLFGFVLMIASAALTGLMLPLIEMAYKRAKQTITYPLVMEFQMVMSLSATIFATVGMLVNNDFKAIPSEAREFQLGEAKYYVVIVSNAIIWQLFTWGAVGVIFCTSALVSAILVSVLLPVSQVLAVIFFHDKFKAEKGISLVLCLWAFVSYHYGEFKNYKKNLAQERSEDTSNKETQDDQKPEMIPNPAP